MLLKFLIVLYDTLCSSVEPLMRIDFEHTQGCLTVVGSGNEGTLPPLLPIMEQLPLQVNKDEALRKYGALPHHGWHLLYIRMVLFVNRNDALCKDGQDAFCGLSLRH